MAEQALDALVVTSLANVLYLTNFDGSSAIAVVTAERVLFITDFRYLTTMSDLQGSPQSCPGLELITVGELVRRDAGGHAWPPARPGAWGSKLLTCPSAAIRG